ncbi:hypothetical protein Tco_0317343 [Tanacetum coccineum]
MMEAGRLLAERTPNKDEGIDRSHGWRQTPHLKGKSFEEIQKLFVKRMKRVKYFVAMMSKRYRKAMKRR